MYSHVIKKSQQRCFRAAWWPTAEASAGPREKTHPLMHLESGQVTRVNSNNLTPITSSNTGL